MKVRLMELLALIEGCLLAALGVVFLKSSGLLAGGTTGLALLADHWSESLGFGQLFFLLNLPFYLLGLKFLGRGFLLRTFFSVTLMSLMTDVLVGLLEIRIPDPVLGATIAGVLLAFGMVSLFKAGGSLGGINILGLFLAQRYGIATARTIFIADLLVMALSLLLFGWQIVLYSVICVAVLGFVLSRRVRPAPSAPTKNGAEPASDKPLSA